MLNKTNCNENKSLWNMENIGMQTMMLLLMALLACFLFPEISFASGTIEKQIANVNTLANVKLKPMVISFATVIGGGYAIINGNIAGALKIIMIVVLLGLIFAWISSGMDVTMNGV